MYHVSQWTGVDVSMVNAAVLAVCILPADWTVVMFTEPPSCFSINYGTAQVNRAGQDQNLVLESGPWNRVCDTCVWRCFFPQPTRRKSPEPWRSTWRWTFPHSSPPLEDEPPRPSPDLRDRHLITTFSHDFDPWNLVWPKPLVNAPLISRNFSICLWLLGNAVKFQFN